MTPLDDVRLSPLDEQLIRLIATLGCVMHPEAIGPWLKAPNPAFEGLNPAQLIERGEIDRLYTIIHDLCREPA